MFLYRRDFQTQPNQTKPNQTKQQQKTIKNKTKPKPIKQIKWLLHKDPIILIIVRVLIHEHIQLPYILERSRSKKDNYI